MAIVNDIFDLGVIFIEVADESASSVGTLHLAVTEQIELREKVRFQEMDASIGVSSGLVVAVGEVENIDVPELLRILFIDNLVAQLVRGRNNRSSALPSVEEGFAVDFLRDGIVDDVSRHHAVVIRLNPRIDPK